jgi:hypothetical protein
MGRPMSAAHARFNVIPRTFIGCVYAVELRNGVIKVGFSRNPRTRMCSLHNLVLRKFGTDISRFHISRNFSNYFTAMKAERNLLARMDRIAQPVKGHNEFFVGVRFGAACTLLRQVTRPPRPSS